jgi:thiamine biosynthesis lipoprotein
MPSSPFPILSINAIFNIRSADRRFFFPSSMKNWSVLIVTVLLLSFGIGCGTQDPPVVERQQILMGTSVSISIAGVDEARADQAADDAFHEIRRIEEIMSTYIPVSDISRINQAAGKQWVKVSPELVSVIREGIRFGELSEGAFDIAIKPLTKIWSYEPGSRPPSREEIERLLPLINYHDVLVDDAKGVKLEHPGMAIVLGGIAKGYAVDRAVTVLQSEGITDSVVNAGGDLRAIGRRSGKRAWRVGIQDPRNKDHLIGEIPLADRAVATSGDYERFYIYKGVRYHHILDPRKGEPARGCRSVTILAPTAMAADALATAVFVMGPETGLVLIEKQPETEGMIVGAKGKIFRSTGFPKGGNDGS